MVRHFFWQMYIYKRVYSYLLKYVWFRWLIFLQITYSLKRELYYPQVPLGGSVNESFARRSLDFSLM